MARRSGLSRPRPHRVRSLLFLPLLVVGGCSLLTDTDGLRGGDGSSALDATNGADGGQESATESGLGDDSAPPTCDAGASFDADPKNCGACGHDCHGGQCVQGTCQAVVLASAQTLPTRVALSATDIYWTNDQNINQVLRTKKDGSQAAPTALVSSLPGAARDVLVDSTRFYWAMVSPGRILSCPFVGCAGAPTVIGGNVGDPNNLALNSTTIFWTQGGGGALTGRPKDATGSITSLSTMPDEANGVAADESFAYWCSPGLNRIMRCAVAGCGDAPTPFVVAQDRPRAIAIDATNIYFSDNNKRSLYVADKAGGTVTPLLTNQNDDVQYIAVDKGTVYFTSGSEVKKCAATGCNNAPVRVGIAQAGAGGIALDDLDIYWSATGAGLDTGQILRVSR